MMSAVDGHLCVELDRLRHRAAPAQATPEPDTARAWEALEQAIIWGWTLVLNPDGTTTVWNPDKTNVLHSHGPPVRPG